MVRVVPAVAEHEPVVESALGQRGGHLQVGTEPVQVSVIPTQVTRRGLQEDPQRLRRGRRSRSG